MMTALNNKIT